MIEIIALVALMATLARFARGRGVKPWLPISIAVVGYVIVVLLGVALIQGPNARWVVLAIA